MQQTSIKLVSPALLSAQDAIRFLILNVLPALMDRLLTMVTVQLVQLDVAHASIKILALAALRDISRRVLPFSPPQDQLSALNVKHLATLVLTPKSPVFLV